MIELFGDQWRRQLDASLRSVTTAPGPPVTVTHVIIDDDNRESTLHLRCADGGVTTVDEVDDGFQVVFRHDRITAQHIASGELSVLDAVMSGRTQVSGDVLQLRAIDGDLKPPLDDLRRATFGELGASGA